MRTLCLPFRLAPLLLVIACTSSSVPTPSGGETPASNGPTGATPAPPRTGPADDPAEGSPPANCTGSTGEIYALAPKKLGTVETDPMCRFEGSVLLIVNVASHCGYTPQYAPLQKLHDKYNAQGFHVLGFPSNSFNQESADEKEISQFCTNEYNITFPMYSIANVNPPDEQPVYTWLKSQPGQEAAIAWNFEKFLISKTGAVAKRFASAVEPDAPELVAAIEAELAK